MTQETYTYRFDPEVVPAQDLEETFMLALMAVESLHSRSQVRMEGRFTIDNQSRTCTIDTATTVGRDLARIFTGFATREYGERAVRIERIASPECVFAHKDKTASTASMQATV